MAIAWVRGASHEQGGPGNDSVSVSLNGVLAGDCLVVSVGFFAFFALSSGPPLISDTNGNTWLMAGTSPVVANPSLGVYEIFTYVAQNCNPGNTTITFSLGNDGGGGISITVDEYSGVASIQAIDSCTFASTPFSSSPLLTSVNSGTISTTEGELLYSAGYTDQTGATLTSSLGFNTRQSIGTSGTLATFDTQSIGGNYSNTISSTGTPNTIHAILVSLSPTPIIRNIVQWGMATNASITTEETTATYPYPNTAGNLLVCFGNLYERTNPVITDTQGNTWHLVYGEGLPTGTFVAAYALNCKAGVNAVTLNTTGGGDDDAITLLISEYSGVMGAFTASSYGGSGGVAESVVNTGNISVPSPNVLLISAFVGTNNTQAFPPAENLETRRFQYGTLGFFSESLRSMAIADTVATVSGNYNNIFNVAPDTGPLEAAILGFQLNYPLTITADNQFKEFGELFVFTGTEFTNTPLQPGDSISSCNITSPGAPANAPVGTYPIFIDDAVGTGLSKYIITYVDGTMIVSIGCFLVDFPLMGPFYTPNGQLLANGTLSVRLAFDCNCPCADYQITGNNHSILNLDSNGMVIGHPRVRPNDQLAPSGSYYIVQAYSESGQLALGPKVLVVESF